MHSSADNARPRQRPTMQSANIGDRRSLEVENTRKLTRRGTSVDPRPAATTMMASEQRSASGGSPTALDATIGPGTCQRPSSREASTSILAHPTPLRPPIYTRARRGPTRTSPEALQSGVPHQREAQQLSQMAGILSTATPGGPLNGVRLRHRAFGGRCFTSGASSTEDAAFAP